ncbi:hypothetical protein GDO86_001361 [Hymenochirus boettgeri]|uniref:Exonuclease domain-containing protein n=1 Tax=Hymenochirus boettgeri TaxID=247094 RepID=A0A8T2KL60_9PIPI|nr:hypothetical protein GDO86_001361 [Hymenochirus boettgeri]
MLRSAGYFQLVVCPFTLGQDPNGCCRPYCQFLHLSDVKDGNTSDTDDHCKGTTDALADTPTEALGKNVEELERINKAIETVKNEVEEKQKKLLLYKSMMQESLKNTLLHVDINKNVSICPDMNVVEASLKSAPSSGLQKGFTCNKKYVIDRRCPATDLEYDPLLNYSAGLFGGGTKEIENSKSKRLQNDKDLETVPHKKLKVASPIRLEIKLQESDDEDILVIDEIPPQADDEDQITNLCIAIEDKPVFEDLKQSTDQKTEEISVLNSPLKKVVQATYFKTEAKSTTSAYNKSHIETLSIADSKVTCPYLSEPAECKEKCSKGDQKQTLLQGKVSVFDISDSSSREIEEPLKPEKNSRDLDSIATTQVNLATPHQSATVMELKSEDSKQKCQLEEMQSQKTNDFILIDSSDLMDHSEVDTDISDSDDPMQECLRIFNEFAEREENHHIKQEVFSDLAVRSLDSPTQIQDAKAWQVNKECMNETKGSDVPSLKRRIAHPSAKNDVKPSSNILVPYRGPSLHQIPCAKIVNVQQQALQISAAVKSGQAFVSSAQKTVTGCLSPAFNHFGQMICVNLVEVQPIVQNTSLFSGFFQGSRLATSLATANASQKRSAAIPVKTTARRKSSIVTEAGSKVPHETRQRYVNSFFEEFLKDGTNVQEAFDKALKEEKAIYDRCGSKNMYLSIAVNSLKKLRDQRSVPYGLQQSNHKAHASGLGKQEKANVLAGIDLYNLLKEYVLAEEQLQGYGFPRPNPEKPGCALLHHTLTKSVVNDALRRVCCRCGQIYSVTLHGKHTRKEECTYHSGKVLRHRVPGGIETRYSCCEAVVGSPGCQMAKLHVNDGQKENMDGFIKTFIKLQPSDGDPGVYSVDCEMCYTTQGLELARVTVVDPNLQVVYDTYVKPDNEIIDYNTRFSGVTEEHLKNVMTSIRDVQAIMLNLFSADTILIGHGLENDLMALKLVAMILMKMLQPAWS